MALPEFKYPSDWTKDFYAYKQHRELIVSKIVDYIENYSNYLVSIDKQVTLLNKKFFSGKDLYRDIKNG